VQRTDVVAAAERFEGAQLERPAQMAESNAGWNRRTGLGQLRGNARHSSIRDGQKNDVRRRGFEASHELGDPVSRPDQLNSVAGSTKGPCQAAAQVAAAGDDQPQLRRRTRKRSTWRA
jgi:hypothetical protein